MLYQTKHTVSYMTLVAHAKYNEKKRYVVFSHDDCLSLVDTTGRIYTRYILANITTP